MNDSPTSDRLGYKSFYRRNLPHIQPVGADLFLTFRLADSLPSNVLALMADDRRCRLKSWLATTSKSHRPNQPDDILHFSTNISTARQLAQHGCRIQELPISSQPHCIT